MKKITLVLAGGLLLFASCKKDWTCTCTVNGLQSSTVYQDVKKSDANDSCNSLEGLAKIADPNASCSIN